MAAIIKSYNGSVGRVYPNLARYITSPNSSYLPDPLVGPQSIRLRKHLHYGQHDPLLMPQPFSIKTPHLPLIRRPDSTSDLRILWARPEEDQFDAIDGFKLSAQPIGLLLGPMVDALEHAYFEIIERMSSWAIASASSSSGTSSSSTPPQSSRTDVQVKSYRGQISYLLGHLRSIPSSFSESRMIFAMCQRCCLELDARITWVQVIAPSWGQMEAWRVPQTREVVGAISSQPLIVESCFCAGIPVWYLRALPVHPQIKVQHWHTIEKPVRDLSGLIEKVTSFEDEDPPYPVIYSGGIENLDRYKLMLDNNTRIAFPSSAFDSPFTSPSLLPSSTSSTSSTSSLPQATAAVVGPSRSTSPAMPRVTPYPKTKFSKQKNPRQIGQQGRNKFLEVDSPLIPPSLPSWTTASKTIGATFNPNQHARDGVPRGYILPEPAMIVNLSADQTHQAYLLMYLKLRDFLLYHIHKLGVVDALLSADEWRKVLGLERVPVTDGTHSAMERNKVLEVLRAASDGVSGLSIDFSHLDAIVPQWKNQPITGPISNAIARDILDEIFAFSFKYELLLIDQFIYNYPQSSSDSLEGSMDASPDVEPGEVVDDLSAPTRSRRFQKLMSPVPGLQQGRMGFGSANSDVRQEAVYSLYRIMTGWGFSYTFPSTKCHILDALSPGHSPNVTELDKAEYAVAHHYIASFADFSKRAPIIPHAS
ncbi:hypothetical protein FB446DRAFT_849579 [Lentinula raphanica]|nr:hypothetical protein FB446DRAFT_849579 [Lentinula raphanica]